MERMRLELAEEGVDVEFVTEPVDIAARDDRVLIERQAELMEG